MEKSLKENRETVDDEQIAEVVSMMSGVPVQRTVSYTHLDVYKRQMLDDTTVLEKALQILRETEEKVTQEA